MLNRTVPEQRQLELHARDRPVHSVPVSTMKPEDGDQSNIVDRISAGQPRAYSTEKSATG